MPARNEARDGILFLAAGVFAGLGNYVFQVIASGRLGAGEFAEFSGWLAHLAAAFVVAGLVQYAANFHPVAHRRRARWLLVLNVLALLLVLAWWKIERPLGIATAATVVGLAAIQGWAIGQSQIRLDFRGLAFAQIANALVRLAVPVAAGLVLASFAFGVAFGFLPALWILTWRLLSAGGGDPVSPARPSWVAPAMLAVTSNLVPQFDLILMQHTQASGDFDRFARASLFYKGIYFFVFIFAQWLLPRQIRGAGNRWFGPGSVAVVAGALSLAAAAASPIVADWVFHWTEVPSPWLVLASCVHMSLLTLIFILVQAECAGARLRLPVAVVVVLGLEAALQLGLALPVSSYYASVLVAQTLLLGVALRLTSRRAS